jgi:hypothetical protein
MSPFPQSHPNALAILGRNEFNASFFKSAADGVEIIRDGRATARLKSPNGGPPDMSGIR